MSSLLDNISNHEGDVQQEINEIQVNNNNDNDNINKPSPSSEKANDQEDLIDGNEHQTIGMEQTEIEAQPLLDTDEPEIDEVTIKDQPDKSEEEKDNNKKEEQMESEEHAPSNAEEPEINEEPATNEQQDMVVEEKKNTENDNDEDNKDDFVHLKEATIEDALAHQLDDKNAHVNFDGNNDQEDPDALISLSIDSSQQGFSNNYQSGEDEGEDEEQFFLLDRQPYYIIYDQLVKELPLERLKNHYLARKMVDYYKKRKMEHVLKITEHDIDTQTKYEKKLETLNELKNIDTEERDHIESELNELRTDKETKLDELTKLFEEMQTKEYDVIKDMIQSKGGGKQISDKYIEYLIRRQKNQSREMAEMRLVYIKMRDRVRDKQMALKALDNLGDDLHLIDYEQLKTDNRNLQDKLEERESELMNLRKKCRNSTQILAHSREKSEVLHMDMERLIEQLSEVDRDLLDCRERNGSLKQDRDSYRSTTTRLMEASGLLTQPLLLRDMAGALNDLNEVRGQLHELKNDYREKSDKVRMIRERIERLILAGTNNTGNVKCPKRTKKLAIDEKATSSNGKLCKGKSLSKCGGFMQQNYDNDSSDIE